MRAKNLIVPVCVLASVVVATSGSALLVPTKAKQIKGEFVAAYAPCTIPTDLITLLNVDACPAYPAGSCRLGVDGSGKYQIKASSSGTSTLIKIHAKLTGLTGCEGQALYFRPIRRLSTEDCAGAMDCTSVDLDGSPSPPLVFGGCTVSDGRCDIKTTASIPSYAFNMEIGEICLVENSSGERVACSGLRLGTPVSPAVQPTPTPTRKRVFITNAGYQGNLGGLAGADSKCQAVATATGLAGTYKAWLSNTATAAFFRLTHSTLDYKRFYDSVVVANGWTDLTDGSLDAPINIDEYGNVLSGEVWTNTLPNGNVGANNCLDWTSSNSSDVGQSGDSTATDVTWTYVNGTAPCDQFKRLYCLEQ